MQELSKDDMTSGSADRLRHELEQAYDSLEKMASSASADHERQKNKSSCDQNQIDRLKSELAQLRYVTE